MIYLSVLCIVLLAYIAYLHYAWSKTRRSLKEMIVENDRHTTASNETGDGEKYLPTNTEGNSTFEIPVAALDTALNVTADTVAMSTPHEIEYTLTFDSASLK